MDAKRWKIVKDLFSAAVERRPGPRTAFLTEACAGDSALLADVRSLLASHARAGDFIERSLCDVIAGAAGPAWTSDASVGESPETLRAELAELIPDYEPLRICGRGSFGTVWIVRDRAGAYRAMKVIELDKLPGTGISRRETQALEHYCRNVPAHANLVQIYHIGRSERWLYYTMELADDLSTRSSVRQRLPAVYQPLTMFEVLSGGQLGVDASVEIVLRLLSGVACLHRAGLVHRDIKPANVILVDREIKLTDLSLVSISRSHMSKAGTPSYMPPDERMDATADTYALGKVLHEMVSGGNLADFPHLPPSAHLKSSKIDLQKLDSFVVMACAANAADRFASAAEMRSALLECRYPLQESLLLELADDELHGGLNEPAAPLRGLQQAVGRLVDPAPQEPYSAELQDSGPTSPASERTGNRTGTGDDRLLGVIDQLIKAIPWLVILILGFFLIYRLTR